MRKASPEARNLVAKHLEWGGCGTVGQIATQRKLTKQAVYHALHDLHKQGLAFYQLTPIDMKGSVEGIVYSRECRWWSGSAGAKTAPRVPNLPMVQRAIAAQPELAVVWRAQAHCGSSMDALTIKQGNANG